MAVNGPVATSTYYHETFLGRNAYLQVDHSSRRFRKGDHYAFYTIAVFEGPSHLADSRKTYAHTGYLASLCTPVDASDVPSHVKESLAKVFG